MTLAPAWLADLAARGPKERKVADKLVRAVSVIYRRTGHLLDLESAPIRLAVTHSAGYGAIASSPARCLNCNAVAPLTKWEFLSQMTREYHLIVSQQAQVQFRSHAFLYLQKCPGKVIADLLADSEHAPQERRP